MIVVDASVLIAHLNANDACHDRAEELLYASAEHALAASTLTLAEVLVGPSRARQLEVARVALQDLEVEEVPIPVGAAERLATLRAGTGLKLPDCCVLLAAEEVKADAVLTLDERLANRVDELGYGWGRDDED